MHYWIWILSLVLPALLPLNTDAAQRKTIIIAADEWCPYNCVQGAEKPGYIVEIAREVFAPMGVDVSYRTLPWKYAIQKTRSGEYDAIVAASYNDAPDFVFPETPQGISPFTVFVRPDSTWRYDGVTSLDGKRIGGVEGVSYGKVVDRYLRKHRKEFGARIQLGKTADASARNIEKLLAGEFDLIIEDKNVVSYYFAERGLPMGVKAAGSVIDLDHVSDAYLYLAFSPKNPDSKSYAKAMMAGMVELRKSGRLKEILSRYGVDEFYQHAPESRN